MLIFEMTGRCFLFLIFRIFQFVFNECFLVLGLLKQHIS